MKLLSLLTLFAAALLAQPTQVRIANGGVNSRFTIKSVTPGTPPTITADNHNQRDGAFIWCADVVGVPNLNYKHLRVINSTPATFQVTDESGVNLAGAGKYYGGGACVPTQLVDLVDHPRGLFDGPTGPLTTSLRDPDGTGPLVAPKLAANPTHPAWLALVREMKDCKAPNLGGCVYPGAPLSFLRGFGPGLMYLADNTKTDQKELVLDLYRNLDTRYSFAPAKLNGCVGPGASTFCLVGGGEETESRWHQSVFLAHGYPASRPLLTPEERLRVGQFVLNGWGGETCENPHVDAPGTVSLTAGSTTVTGVGTSFDQSLVGRQIWGGGGTSSVRLIQSVTDATTLTLAAPAEATLIGVDFWHLPANDAPWQPQWCGLPLSQMHHAYAPGMMLGKQVFRLAAPITSTTQTELVLHDAGVITHPVPFLINAGGEIINAVARVGNNLTVERGYYGTTKVASWGSSTAHYAYAVPRGLSQSSKGSSARIFDTTATVANQVGPDGVITDVAQHNLFWNKLYGSIIWSLVLIDDHPKAKQIFENSWNYFYTFVYPYERLYRSMPQKGAFAYITRYAEWTAAVAIAIKNSTGGVVDIKGDWLLDTAANYSYNWYPWKPNAMFAYTDTATANPAATLPRHTNGFTMLGYLFPDSKVPKYARYHIDKRLNWYSTCGASCFDSYSVPFLFIFEPLDVSAPGPNSIDLKADSRNAVLFKNREPEVCPPLPTGTTLAISMFRKCGDTGWWTMFSYSDVKQPDTAVLTNLSAGLGPDHLGFKPYRNYIIGKKALLFAGNNNSANGPAGTSASRNFITSPMDITAVDGGFAYNSASAAAKNCFGSRGSLGVQELFKETDTYTYARVDGKCSFQLTFGVDRMKGEFLHVRRPGQQDYIFVHDDFNLTTSKRFETKFLNYCVNDATGCVMAAAYSRTGQAVQFTHTNAGARLNSVMLTPTDFTVTEANDGTLYQTRSTIFQEPVARTGPRFHLALHQPLGAANGSMPPSSLLATTSANVTGAIVEDPAAPIVTIWPNDTSQQLESYSWAVPVAHAAAHQIGIGLKPGVWQFTKDGVTIYAAKTVEADGSIEILPSENHGSGAYVATYGAAPPPPPPDPTPPPEPTPLPTTASLLLTEDRPLASQKATLDWGVDENNLANSATGTCDKFQCKATITVPKSVPIFTQWIFRIRGKDVAFPVKQYRVD